MELGHHPDDTEDGKLRKSSLLIMSAPFAVAALIWGLLYFERIQLKLISSHYIDMTHEEKKGF